MTISHPLRSLAYVYLISTETDADYAVRLISLEDEPSLPIFTFRMWFLAIGLSCFGAVLGQIFVSDQNFWVHTGLIFNGSSISALRQSPSVSSSSRYVSTSDFTSWTHSIMFAFQIIAYIMGKGMEEIIPGPYENARIRTRDNWFWRLALSCHRQTAHNSPIISSDS